MQSTRMLLALAVALVLIGCPAEQVTDDDTLTDDDDTLTDDDDAQSDDDFELVYDLDGDGWTESEGDCDDSDPSVHPGAEEVCDGVDNDCNGQLDDGFPDVDADGVADCVDSECDAAAPPLAWSGILASCPWVGTPAANPWSIDVEWMYNGETGSWSEPAIANLTDDNGDGAVDERDVPDIVVTMAPGEDEPALIALHGDGSGLIFGIEGGFTESGVAIADVDLDGIPDVVTLEKYGAGPDFIDVVAFRNDGSELWRSNSFAVADLPIGVGSHPQPSVADVDGDGEPEVVTQWAILSGADGATEVLLSPYYASGIDYSAAWFPVLADLDFDGSWEIIQENSVYAANGTSLWDGPDVVETYSIPSAVADLDGDGDAEVVMAQYLSVQQFDEGGALLVTYPELPGRGGQLTVADFDGDGSPEIAATTHFEVVMMEVDGTVAWTSSEHYDSSGAAGCSGFDFDLDGAYELLCLDEYELRIFDGRTGATRFVWADYQSSTVFGYPAIADVDNDGSAEIVVTCDRYHPDHDGHCRGVAVLGHTANAWPPAGPVWSVQDYTPMRIRPDGQVETELVAPWSVHNMYKARPSADGLADLLPVAGETCLASCDPGLWQVTWGVANQGMVNVRDPVSVAIYQLDGASETLLMVETIDDLEYGYQKPGPTLNLTPDPWGDGLRLVIDDDGTGLGSVEECDETNNSLEIPAPVCP